MVKLINFIFFINLKKVLRHETTHNSQSPNVNEPKLWRGGTTATRAKGDAANAARSAYQGIASVAQG